MSKLDNVGMGGDRVAGGPPFVIANIRTSRVLWILVSIYMYRQFLYKYDLQTFSLEINWGGGGGGAFVAVEPSATFKNIKT